MIVFVDIGRRWCRGGYGPPTQGGARWRNVAACPTCGRRFTVNRNGRLRAHLLPRTP